MKKKKIALKILAIIMSIISIRGIITNTDFSFTGLPMYAIYLILSAVILLTLLVVYLAFIKKSK